MTAEMRAPIARNHERAFFVGTARITTSEDASSPRSIRIGLGTDEGTAFVAFPTAVTAPAKGAGLETGGGVATWAAPEIENTNTSEKNTFFISILLVVYRYVSQTV